MLLITSFAKSYDSSSRPQNLSLCVAVRGSSYEARPAQGLRFSFKFSSLTVFASCLKMLILAKDFR